MIEAKEMVEIWYGVKKVRLSKEYVIVYLIKEMTKTDYWKSLIVYDQLYRGTYDCILKEMDDITTIQIYEDNVIRLHLKHGHYQQPKSIIFTALEKEVEVLKDFVK